MAWGDVKICNTALARIGNSDFISALEPEEASTEATVCNLFYAEMRDVVLQQFRWPFAQKRVSLGLVGEEPNDDWLYSYRVPSDFIRANRIVSQVTRARGEQAPPPFEMGFDATGLLIFTDQETAKLQYTARFTDASKFSPEFGNALSWRMAVELAMPLSIKEDLLVRAQGFYKQSIADAREAHANEGTEDRERASELETIRG